MSTELSDWIAGLSASGAGSPGAAAAVEIAAALTAVLDAPDLSALPMVADLADPAEQDGDPREAVDCVYAGLMDALRMLRRQAAEAGEETLTRRMQSSQLLVDQFRITKETAKAHFTAAEAVRAAQTALALADDLSADGNDGNEAGEFAGAAGPDDEAEASVSEAAGRLRALVADGSRLAASILADGDGAPPAGNGHQSPAAADGNGTAALPAGLLELRADALGTDARLLLADEPAGTITLLAVLDDAAAVREHRDVAIGLASDLLTRIRATGWPSADDPATAQVHVAGSGAFLACYFPLDAAQVRDRAAELIAVASLRAQREDAGLSVADVAERSGLDPADISRIETQGLRDAPVGHVAAYTRALGRRLTLSTHPRDGATARLW